MARNERSAGVILFREREGQRQYLLLDYGKHWDYPKGHIEKGEDEGAAAVRELAEETGIGNARFVQGFRHVITYFFRGKNKQLIRKEVVFFAAQSQATDADVKLSHEHVGFAFVPYGEAIQKLTFKTARAALEKAEAFLEQAQR